MPISEAVVLVENSSQNNTIYYIVFTMRLKKPKISWRLYSISFSIRALSEYEESMHGYI